MTCTPAQQRKERLPKQSWKSYRKRINDRQNRTELAIKSEKILKNGRYEQHIEKSAKMYLRNLVKHILSWIKRNLFEQKMT